MSGAQPIFRLIAGPDGVGKTTCAMRRLNAISGSVNFVNLDEIARGRLGAMTGSGLRP